MGKNKRWLIWLQTVLIGIVAFLFCYNDWCYSADTMVKDVLCQRPRAINQDIVIVAIDEKTLSELGPINTWSRVEYAKVLQALGDYPSVVGFDIMFMGNMDDAGDEAFEEELRKHDNVIMASHLLYDTVTEVQDGSIVGINHMHVAEVEMPYFSNTPTVGYTNIAADSDGVVRSLLPFASTANDEEKCFSYTLYQAYCEKKGLSPMLPKTDSNGKQWIYYAGKPFEYEAISMVDVINAKVDPKIFTDRLVMIGAYATGLQDQFSVPNSSNQMYGVEIHANIVQSLIDGKYPVPISQALGAMVIGVLAAGLYLAFRKMNIRFACVLFAVCEVLLGGGGLWLFVSANMILPMAYGMLFVFLAFLLALIENYIQVRTEKKKIASAFRKYVAPQVVDGIMKSGQYHIKLGGENRDIAVLFVDIRGFTPLSESLEPEQVVEILNLYLNLTTNSIFDNLGTLDKFIGDATMAVFNAPFDLDDYVFRSVCAAWDIVAGAKKLEECCMERFGKAVSFGVGVNCGPAVVGNIGCDFRMDYTAIGDTVNTAARLEANAKRGQVLISQKVYDCVKDRIEAEPIGEIPLKGKSQGVFVYSLTKVEGKESLNESSSDHS